MRLIALTTGALRVDEPGPWLTDGLPTRREPFLVPADGYMAGHLRLARYAIAEGWDESVVVVQDDVALHGLPIHSGTICAYGGRRANGHVCPWAFSATPRGWVRLAAGWQPVPGLDPFKGGVTCHSWKPDVVWRPGIAEHRSTP